MKFIEIINGPQQQVNNEEYFVIEKIRESSPCKKESLSEREQTIARMLTSRGVLRRVKIDSELYYKLN